MLQRPVPELLKYPGATAPRSSYLWVAVRMLRPEVSRLRKVAPAQHDHIQTPPKKPDICPAMPCCNPKPRCNGPPPFAWKPLHSPSSVHFLSKRLPFGMGGAAKAELSERHSAWPDHCITGPRLRKSAGATPMAVAATAAAPLGSLVQLKTWPKRTAGHLERIYHPCPSGSPWKAASMPSRYELQCAGAKSAV